MPGRSRAPFLLGVPWLALVAVALWFRVTSLEGVEEPYADEAQWGVQAARLVAGKSIALRTPTGNPANFAMIGVEAPLILAFGPKLWILRAPTVAAGLLAVVLAYVWGRRWADRPTALVAATALAVMPVAITSSRFGLENGVVPLFVLLTLHQAFLRRRFRLLLAFVAAQLVHPTAILMGPIVVAVHLGRTLPRVERSRWWRVLLDVGVGSAVVLGAFVLTTLGGDGHANHREFFYQAPDWARFTVSFERYLLGLIDSPVFRGSLHGHRYGSQDLLFWGLLPVIVVTGLTNLVRRRRWDQLALLGGLPVSLAALHLTAGPAVFEGICSRYASFTLVPTAFGLAFLARWALVASPAEAGPARFRPVPVVAGLALGGCLLTGVKTHYFDVHNPWGLESIWTLSSENAGVSRQAFDLIRADRDRSDASTRPRGIVVESWWVGKPIEYLASDQRGLAVVYLDDLQRQLPPERLSEFVERRFHAGDFLVGLAQTGFEAFRAQIKENPKLARKLDWSSLESRLRALPGTNGATRSEVGNLAVWRSRSPATSFDDPEKMAGRGRDHLPTGRGDGGPSIRR